MKNPDLMLKQIKTIKWLVMFIAVCFVIAAGSLVGFSMIAATLAEESGSCGEESFRDKISGLIDEGKTEDAVRLAEARIETHPDDEDAYWYRGVAFYLQKKWQPAIADFNKVEELAPSWKEQYVEPYRTAAQTRLSGG